MRLSPVKPTKKQLADAVRDYLIAWGQSQESFAARPPEMTAATLSRFLNGAYRGDYPDPVTITKISKKLNFDSVEKFEQFCVERNFYGLEAFRFCIEIGKARTLWLRLVGNGERGSEIAPSNISCILNATPIPYFNPEIQSVIDRVRRDHNAGKISFENNRLVALEKVHVPIPNSFVVENIDTWPPAGIKEDRKLRLTFRLADYASFYAIARDPEGQRLRNESLRLWRPDDGPKPQLSLGVGINVAIFSGDDRFVVGYRAKNQGARPGEIDVGAVEGISLHHDLQKDGTTIHIHDVVRRALREEYDILDDNISEMHVLGFGYDLQYCQWNAIAVCYCKSSGEAIIRRQKTAAIDAAEFSLNEAIGGGPKAIFSFLGDQHKIWSCALATAFYACIHKYGKDTVLRDTADFELSNKTQYYTRFYV